MSYDGTTKWKVTLKQAKALRALFRVLFALCAFVAPTIVISVRYDLFIKFSGYKLSVLGLFLLITVAWAFRKKMLQWVKSWEYSIWKHIILGLTKVWVYILMIAILRAAKQGSDNFIFCAEWFAVFEIAAYLVLDPLCERYDFIVKRMIKKNERKEDIKEALAELEASKE